MRYTITKRTALTFSLVLILMVAIGITSILEMKNAQNSTNHIITEARKGVVLVKFQSEVSILLTSAKDHLITGDNKYKEIYQRAEERVESLCDQLQLVLTDPAEKAKLVEIKREMDGLHKMLPQLMEMHTNSSKDSLAMLIEKVGIGYGKGISMSINNMIEDLRVKTYKMNTKAQQERKDAFIFITIIIIAGVVISIFFVSLTLNHISKPILRLVEITHRIAARDFKIDFIAEENDEIGMLIKAINTMAEEIEVRYSELEDFSYIAAHDLKSPLNAIIGSAQLLLDDQDTKLNDDEKKLLQNIAGSGKNMNRLISDLLEFAKAGKVEFSKEPVSMSVMLKDIKTDLLFTLKEKNAELIIENNLPAFICDPTRFPQVWNNLISNAIKYNDREKPIVQIGTVSKDEYPDKYCFFVKDNGIGIESEYLEKVFHTFQRATTEKQYEGTGIGLAIVKRIIEYHNGKVWIESTKDVGTTIYFTIPRKLTINQ